MASISVLHTDERGDRWARVGYSTPRSGRYGSTYRYVRERDGARVRVRSNKYYTCVVSKAALASTFDVPDGTNETVPGGGAKSLSEDRATAVEVFKRHDSGEMARATQFAEAVSAYVREDVQAR